MKEVYFEPTGTYIDRRPDEKTHYLVEEKYMGPKSIESRLQRFIESRPNQNSLYEEEISLAQEFFANNGHALALPSVAILDKEEYIPALCGLYGISEAQAKAKTATICKDQIVVQAPAPSGAEQFGKNMVLGLLLHEGAHATAQNRTEKTSLLARKLQSLHQKEDNAAVKLLDVAP